MAKSYINKIFKCEGSDKQAIKGTKYIEDAYFKNAIPATDCLFFLRGILEFSSSISNLL